MAEVLVTVGLGLDEGSADLAAYMSVGDSITFGTLEGPCDVVYPIPDGFTQSQTALGPTFTATKANIGYPYAQFQVSGFSGKQITTSVVVYP